MNKQYIRNTTTVLGAMLILMTSSAPAKKFEELVSEGQTFTKINAVFLAVTHVEEDGAHLKKDQWILLVGPTGPHQKYHLQPLKVPGTPDHDWKDQLHPANRLGGSGSKHYMVNVAVKDHDPAECADHQMVMFIEDEDADGPTEIEIWGSDCSDTGLDHGGTAHAER